MMPAYFVILAGMRTGSNLLEEHLASVHDIAVHGELFNPHFFGTPKSDSQFGLSLTDRADDPIRVIRAMRKADQKLSGFRLFHDHDPRVLEHILTDPSCAKVILTRRPIDSFVSLQIARATGQWWLGDARSARTAKVTFDADAFADFQTQTTAFHRQIDRTLQASGQTAFRLSYDDLADPEIIAGLARFLGAEGQPDAEQIKARVQNPTPVEERLTNPEDARRYLASEAADIGEAPVHEPDRGPGVRFFCAGQGVPLLYMPIRGASDDPVRDWLAEIGEQAPLTGLNQRDLRRWKRHHPGHLSFTVLRQPLDRAHDTFCRHILPADQPNYADIRHALIRQFKVQLPASWPAPSWSLDDHRAAFLGFLGFLNRNLNGQTSLRVDSTWATQERLLSAIATLVVPDRVLRAGNLAFELSALAEAVGLELRPKTKWFTAPHAYPISTVANDEINKAAETAYRRDYMMFGFPTGPSPDPVYAA